MKSSQDSTVVYSDVYVEVTPAATLPLTLTSFKGICYDSTNRKIYILENITKKIYSMSETGSDLTALSITDSSKF